MNDHDSMTNSDVQPPASVPSPVNDLTPPRRRLWLTFGLLLVVGGAAGGWYVWQARTKLAPPTINLDDADPDVNLAITKARDETLHAPESGAAWGRLGRVLAANGFLEEARTCFIEAERLEPKEPRWPYYHGLMLVFSDSDAAIVQYQHAVQLRGSAPIMRLRLATALAEQGRLNEAEEQYRLLVDNPELAARAELGLARLAYQRGDLDAARTFLGRSATQPTTQKASSCLLAEIAQRANDPATATREGASASQLPNDPDWNDPFLNEITREKAGRDARLEYLLALRGQQLHQQAASGLQDLVRDYPDWDQAWLNFGRLLLDSRAYAPAAAAFRSVLRLTPNSVSGHFYLGIALAQGGENREAADHFREAVRLKPDHAMANYNLGHCLKRLNDPAGAQTAFREALRCRPDMASAHANLGELLAAQGNKPAAIEELRLSLDLNPNDPAPKKLLEQLGREK